MTSPDHRWRVSVAIVLSAVTCGLVIIACADDSGFVSLGPSGDPGTDAGMLFTPPPQAGVDAAKPPALLCATNVCPEGFKTCPVIDAFGSSGPPTYACGTNLSDDDHNCGACGNDCGGTLSDLNVQTSCVNGVCRADCYNLHRDCNGVIDDGCEVDPLSDPDNCGGCGNKCAPGVECLGGVCGCPPGQTDCDGTCVDLTTNDDNCGACDFNCDDHPVGDAGALPPNMRHGCAASKCTELHCDHRFGTLWENCNGSLTDGCEADIGTDPNNCAKCGAKCDPGKSCFDDISNNPGIACQCPAGRTMCGGVTCVDVESDPHNCGSCDYQCPDPVAIDPTTHNPTDSNGRASCDRGRCGYVCYPGFADCNGAADDGCETELAKDPRNCGGCGITCDTALGQPCVNGECVKAQCDAGTAPQ